MPARSGKLAENRTQRNRSSMNQTVLAIKKFRMTKLLIISPYACSFYTLYAIRNTLYATRYTRIEYPESSNDLCKTNPISEVTK